MAFRSVDAAEFKCSFAKGKWSQNDWIRVKSARWEYLGGWIQKNNYIENVIPFGAEPKALLGKLAGQTYTSMVMKEKIKGDITIVSDMEFTFRMATLIVIAPTLGQNTNGVPEYREHFEVVIFDKGVNVWHHFFKDGKPFWKKAAYSNFTLKPNIRYTLEVKIEHTSKGKMMKVSVDGHEFGYMDDSLPDEFYVGITGCEGINKFYNFAVK
jgi:hypothetical protein